MTGHKMKKRVWGVYDGPWACKSASQLHNEEVLPRLRRYLELGEKRLGYFEKPMRSLTPLEMLSIVASVNACASAIFQRCTVVRGQWQRSYEPDVDSPTNKEKLKKFQKIVQNHPDDGLLPLLEQLAAGGDEEYAFQILKTIRKMAHINKKIPKGERDRAARILSDVLPLAASATPPGSPQEVSQTQSIMTPSFDRRASIPMTVSGLAEEALRDTRRCSEPSILPSLSQMYTIDNKINTAATAQALATTNAPTHALIQEIAALRQELGATRERLRWFEMQDYKMRMLHEHSQGMKMNSIPLFNKVL